VSDQDRWYREAMAEASENKRLRSVIREAFAEGVVCTRCGEFYDGLDYGSPPRTGCRSDRAGMHNIKGLISLPEAAVTMASESLQKLLGEAQ